MNTGVVYTGKFSSTYIEEMTKKTGNYKKFTLFITMLNMAVNPSYHSNHSTTIHSNVLIDVLTYNDLQLLKQHKYGTNNNNTTAVSLPAATATVQHNNKRYFILTYSNEFDRVHYPLPLKADEQQIPSSNNYNNSQSHGTAEYLQQELNPPHTQYNDYQVIIEENKQLKQQIHTLLTDHRHHQLSQLSSSNHTNTTQQYKSDLAVLNQQLMDERIYSQQLETQYKLQLNELNDVCNQLRDSERHYRLQCRKLQQELDTINATRYARSSTSTINKSINKTSNTIRSRSITRITPSINRSVIRTPSPSYMRPTNGSLNRSSTNTPVITRRSSSNNILYSGNRYNRNRSRSRDSSIDRSIHTATANVNRLQQSANKLVTNTNRKGSVGDIIHNKLRSPNILYNSSPLQSYSKYAYSPVNNSAVRKLSINDSNVTIGRPRRERSPSLTQSNVLPIPSSTSIMSSPRRSIIRHQETNDLDSDSKLMNAHHDHTDLNTIHNNNAAIEPNKKSTANDTIEVNDRLSALQRFLKLEKAKLNVHSTPN